MEKSRFSNLVDTFYGKAKKGGWVPIYNSRLDYFTWAKPKLSENTHLIKISNEAYFYINPKGETEGLAIEYLKTNFMEHNPGLKKEVMSKFTKKVNENDYTVPKNKTNQLDGFLQAIRADIWKEVGNDKDKIQQLDKLIQTAIRA